MRLARSVDSFWRAEYYVLRLGSRGINPMTEMGHKI